MAFWPMTCASPCRNGFLPGATSSGRVPTTSECTSIAARYRVDSTCERVANMQHVAWFVLPPSQEFYYRRNYADYRDLPAYRGDCERSHGGEPMEFLYPNAAGRIYIPVELDGHKGRTIFE